MSSASRKLRRNKKKQAKKDMQEKLGLFEKIPDNCSACEKAYDKKDKEMVMTWNVVVREKEEIVRLYCPECWSMAKDLIEKVIKDETNVQEDV
jgi:hypothetical protein